MSIVARPAQEPTPTHLASLPGRLASAQDRGLERYLDQPKRGVPMLTLVLAWLDSGRPFHLEPVVEPVLTALLSRTRLPGAMTLRRSLDRLLVKQERAAVEAAYQAELPHRAGWVWAALDVHQVPYGGRGTQDGFQKGWSGSHGRSLRGYRLLLAIATDMGQVITFVLPTAAPATPRCWRPWPGGCAVSWGGSWPAW